ncbi:DoxX family protein [Candidatus Palauibacter polyketidifaciens]|uniref:DoxX family protein n=1 Tax=Candidatus Palauibacter polyketidifaciens TaxID=3056740 RepID=UPI00139EB3C3|nr:DoxX family protein [Candidatus Palauibacter polyketidifaciens]MDE2719435.1 DoxX family protein [Candidatus Palauibacter polyketidifaciens]MYE34279.1 DoxX family protein [Gemmatimonadales bacterium]
MNRELKAKAALAPRSWAAFVARMILGLIFFMAGFWKVFELGAVQHARGLFVEAYADTFLPAWSLWAAGVAIPFIELVCGALMLAGWRRRIAALGLGGILILVTFGHLLAEPLYVFSAHVIPRTLLLIIVLLLFEDDRLSLDARLARRTASR